MYRSAAKLLIPAAIACALVAACESNPDVDFADDDDDDGTGVVAGVPLNVAAIAGTGSIALSWNAPATGDPPTSYRVLVATTAFDSWSASLPGAFETTAGCCTFSGPFSDSVRYWLGVSAVNPAGEGPLSQVVSASPPGWEGFSIFDLGDDSAAVTDVAATSDAVFVSGIFMGDLDEVSSNGIYDAFVTRLDRSGKRVWTRSFGGTDFDRSFSVAADSGGNVVLAGYQVVAPSSEDYVVVRYDGTGAQSFKKTLGVAGAISDRAHGVAVDGDWQIHVAGQTLGSLDGVTNNGGADAFYVRFDAAGNRLLTRLVGTGMGDSANSIAVLADGTAYVVGSTFGTLPSGSVPANSNAGGEDAFLTKFDAAGTFQWTKQVGSGGADRATSVAIDASGDIYVAGYAGGNLGDGALIGLSDPFIGKYSPTGNQLWLHMLNGSASDEALGVSVSNTLVYVVGRSNSSIGSGTYDGFMAAYTLAGSLEWSRAVATSTGDQLEGVSVAPDGSVYAGGATNTLGTLDGIVGKFFPDGTQY